MTVKMKKIIITGANGFIGSHLTDFLIKKDYAVFAVDLPNRKWKNLNHYTKGQLEFSSEKN